MVIAARHTVQDEGVSVTFTVAWIAGVLILHVVEGLVNKAEASGQYRLRQIILIFH